MPTLAVLPRLLASCVLLTSAGIAAAADGEGFSGWSDPAAPLQLVVDRPGLEVLLAAPPFAVWRDPKAAAWTEHVRAQFRILSSEPRTPPVDQVLTEARALRVQGWWPTAGAKPRNVERWFAMFLDAGASSAALRESLDQMRTSHRSVETELPPFAGVTQRECFFGWAGEVVAFGGVDVLRALPLANARGAAEPRARLRFDAAAMLPSLAQVLDAYGTGEAADAAFPGWRSSTPRLEVTLDATAEGSGSVVEVAGLPRLPLRPVDPAIAARVDQGRQVVLTLGVDPEQALTLWMALVAMDKSDGIPWAEFRPQAERAFADELGVAPGELAAALSGDIALHGGWTAGPLPQVGIVLGLRDAERAQRLLLALGERLGGMRGELPGAQAAARFATVAGTLTVAVGPGVLVIGTDDEQAAALLAAPAARGAQPAPALSLRADLPAIAKQWLPLAYGQAAQLREPLGNDPLWVLGNVTTQVAFNRRDDGATPAERIQQALKSEWVAAQAARLWPNEDAVAAWNRCVAVYRSDTDERQLRAVIRIKDGFLVRGTHERQDRAPITAAALAQRMTGWSPLGGPAPEALAETVVPERAVFDARWLPPQPALLAHLRPWTVVITVGDGTLSVRERGLPAAGVLAGIGGFASFIGGLELGRQLQRAEAEAAERAVRRAHAPKIAALERAGRALREPAARREVPAKASALVALGVPLAELAPLCAEPPASPEALDTVGRWFAEPAGNRGARWVVALADGWHAVLTHYGQVLVTKDDLRLPAADAAAPSDVPTPAPAPEF